MLPVHDHFSLICSEYFARSLQPDNPLHSVVHLSLGFQKHEIHPLFRLLHRLAPYLSNDILHTTDYKSTIKYLLTETVSQSTSSLVPNCFLQCSLHIATEEANLPSQYRTSLSKFCSSYSCSLHFYRDKICLLPYYILYIASHIHDRKRPMRENVRDPGLPSEFIFVLSFYDLPPVPLSLLLLMGIEI